KTSFVRSIGIALSLLALVALFGCSAAKPARAPVRAGAPLGPIVDFRYESADDRLPPITAESLRGRATVIVFLATYDMASQAQARFLTMAVRHRRPRMNAAAVFLELPENRPLVAAFRDTLSLPYPVAMGDKEVVSGKGPFGDVHVVPSLVVLDAEGRLVT